MQVLRRPKLTIFTALVALLAVIALPFTVSAASLHSQRTATATTPHGHINCVQSGTLCTEVYDSEQVFGEGIYVGHDEPSTLFYSNVPGSGNHMRYEVTIP